MNMAASIGGYAIRSMTRKKASRSVVYPVVGLKQARQLAQAERTKLASNIDPSIDRQINKQKAKEATANSFKAVTVEWHTKQHTWTKNHSMSMLHKLEVDVFPYIGMYPISTIEAPQLLLYMIRIIEQRWGLYIQKKQNKNLVLY